MKILFVGPAAEARGFALAGAAVEIGESKAKAAAALASARRPDSGIGLVLLAPSLADLISEERQGRGFGGPPALLAVPEGRP